jgi:hypothetical protein
MVRTTTSLLYVRQEFFSGIQWKKLIIIIKLQKENILRNIIKIIKIGKIWILSTYKRKYPLKHYGDLLFLGGGHLGILIGTKHKLQWTFIPSLVSIGQEVLKKNIKVWKVYRKGNQLWQTYKVMTIPHMTHWIMWAKICLLFSGITEGCIGQLHYVVNYNKNYLWLRSSKNISICHFTTSYVSYKFRWSEYLIILSQLLLLLTQRFLNLKFQFLSKLQLHESSTVYGFKQSQFPSTLTFISSHASSHWNIVVLIIIIIIIVIVIITIHHRL